MQCALKASPYAKNPCYRTSWPINTSYKICNDAGSKPARFTNRIGSCAQVFLLMHSASQAHTVCSHLDIDLSKHDRYSSSAFTRCLTLKTNCRVTQGLHVSSTDWTCPLHPWCRVHVCSFSTGSSLFIKNLETPSLFYGHAESTINAAYSISERAISKDADQILSTPAFLQIYFLCLACGLSTRRSWQTQSFSSALRDPSLKPFQCCLSICSTIYKFKLRLPSYLHFVSIGPSRVFAVLFAIV